MKQNDAAYLDLVLKPIRVCAKYKPKFGQGAKGDGLTLDQLQTLYQSDPFYRGTFKQTTVKSHRIFRKALSYLGFSRIWISQI